MASGCSFGYEILTNESEGDGEWRSDGVGLGGDLALGGGRSSTDDDPSGSGAAGLGGDGGAGGGGAGGESPYGTPSGEPKEHCTTIPRLARPPVLDGFVDQGIYLKRVEPVGWRNPDEPLPSGYSALLGAAWRPDGVYFFVVITDSDLVPAPPPADGEQDADLWQGDSVEIYLDYDGVFDAPLGMFNEMGTRQVIVAPPSNGEEENTERAAIRFSDGAADVDSVYDSANWVTRPIVGGYVVEVFFDATTLNLSALELSEGDTVGINFGHNVSGENAPDGNRLSQYFLKVREPLEGDDNDFPFRNEATFCESLLVVE